MFKGRQLRRFREQRNLSAVEVAQELGISRSYVTLLESGKRAPNEKLQEKIAVFFGVSVDEFQKEPIDNESESDEQPVVTSPAMKTTVTRQETMESSMTLSAAMVYGMAQGLLQEIDMTLKTNMAPNQTDVCLGQVHLQVDEFEDTTDFFLFSCREQVTLRLQSIKSIDRWTTASGPYVVLPHIRILGRECEGEHPYWEYIWFTNYISIYQRLLQCRRWSEKGKAVEILDDVLSGYMPQ